MTISLPTTKYHTCLYAYQPPNITHAYIVAKFITKYEHILLGFIGVLVEYLCIYTLPEVPTYSWIGS